MTSRKPIEFVPDGLKLTHQTTDGPVEVVARYESHYGGSVSVRSADGRGLPREVFLRVLATLYGGPLAFEAAPAPHAGGLDVGRLLGPGDREERADGR